MRFLLSKTSLRVAVIAALCAGVLSCNNSVPEFTGDAAWRYLVDQYEMGARVPETPAHERAVRYITDHLQAQGGHVTLQRFSIPDPYNDGDLVLTNIIGSFAVAERKRVLLCAHFDCRPWADQEEVDSLRAKPVPGANDAASGVAVLLELADIMSKRMPPGLGVDLVFFDGEDYGKEGDYQYYLLGSKYFAANLGGYRPACGVLLDMVGAQDAVIKREGNSVYQAGELVDDLFARASRLGLTMFVPEEGEPMLDDHVPLLRAGIPMVDLIHFPWQYWHTLGDTPDNCSQESLRQTGVLLRDFLYDYTYQRPAP